MRNRKLFFGFLLVIIIGSMQPCVAVVYIDETVNVSGIGYRYYIFTTTKDDVKIKVSISVISGNDITVGVIKYSYLDNWENGQSVPAYISKPNIVSGSYEATLEGEGNYVVLLDNTDSLSGVTVNVKIELVASSLGVIVAIGIIIIAAFVAGGWWFKRKQDKERQTQQMYGKQMYGKQPAQPVQPVQPAPRFCISCGVQLTQNDQFCKKCGTKQ